MKILIIGSGGREHCLAWKINQSKLVTGIYIAPGNAGTAFLGKNVNIGVSDINRLVEFAKEKDIGLTVVGPEAPLAAGIVDRFNEEGLTIFGPNKELARLESSKQYAKEVMQRFNIPTASARVFSDSSKAVEYIQESAAPMVVKADGLAAGKGVIVCQDKDTALKAVKNIMQDQAFGSAGDKIIIEDYLEGQEVSVLAISNGKDYLTLIPSQDHKRAFEDDKGPNTGGMGAYAPAVGVDEELSQKIKERIFSPLIEGLAGEGKAFKGVLYGGLMIQKGEPYVLEFNVRFGDPETQVVLPKLKNDLVEIILMSIKQESFAGYKLNWDRRACLCSVVVSGGYPGSYEKGKEIQGLEKFDNQNDILLFHAGTQLSDTGSLPAKVLSCGGRVLNLVGLGKDLRQARDKVYQNIEKINFQGMYYRKDIGCKALSCLADNKKF
jgi:phosphoribosylamine---glycine ligase